MYLGCFSYVGFYNVIVNNSINNDLNRNISKDVTIITNITQTLFSLIFCYFCLLQIQAVCLSVDNSLVMSGASDSTIHMWNQQRGEKLCSFYAHSGITDLALTLDNSRVLAKTAHTKSKLMILKTINI